MDVVAVVLREVQQMNGIGIEMIGLEIGVRIPDEIVIQEASYILVEVRIETTAHQEVIQLTQKLLASQIVVEEAMRILPLEGILWIRGQSNQENIKASSAKIYYCSAT